MRIPNLQKDKEQQTLINSAYLNLSEIAKEFDTHEDIPIPGEIQFVSFEQALKELVSLKNSS